MKQPLKSRLSLKGLTVFDRFLLFTVFFLSLLGPLGLGPFLAGVITPESLPVWSCLAIPFSGVLLFVVLLISLSSWQVRLQSKFAKWLLPLSLVFLIGIDCFMFFKFHVSEPFTYGFKYYVAKQADLPEIRNWLDTQKERCSEHYNPALWKDEKFAWPSDINWPSSLLKLRPSYVWFLTDDKGYPEINVVYGGGMSHWGFIVGEPNLVVPRTESVFIVIKVDKGCYVWFD
jgi:hypothetical protein